MGSSAGQLDRGLNFCNSRSARVANIAALVRSEWGGAATPPYRVLVGRTCRSAVTFCERAKRCSQPAGSMIQTLPYPQVLPTPRQRLGDNLAS
jgi:hypothetical protein